MGRLVLARTSAPAAEPLSLSDAKAQLVVEHDEDDGYINSLITAARTAQEEEIGRALITQTWTLKLDSFPRDGEILIPRPPLQSVSSITYIDTDGATQTLAASSYDVHTNDLPGRVTRAYGVTWPSVRSERNAVTVTFVAGYGASASTVPASLVQALKLRVARMYQHREPEVTGTVIARFGSVEALEAPYVVRWF